MQKVPAIFKVRLTENAIDIKRNSNEIDKKICSLLISKKNLGRLHNSVVDYDKVDKQNTINTF